MLPPFDRCEYYTVIIITLVTSIVISSMNVAQGQHLLHITIGQCLQVCNFGQGNGVAPTSCDTVTKITGLSYDE